MPANAPPGHYGDVGAELERSEARSDKDMGEDDDNKNSGSKADEDDAADLAPSEALPDKDMGEEDDEIDEAAEVAVWRRSQTESWMRMRMRTRSIPMMLGSCNGTVIGAARSRCGQHNGKLGGAVISARCSGAPG